MRYVARLREICRWTEEGIDGLGRRIWSRVCGRTLGRPLSRTDDEFVVDEVRDFYAGMGLELNACGFEADIFDSVEVRGDRHDAHDVIYHRRFTPIEAMDGGYY
jgi:hypothetical protein